MKKLFLVLTVFTLLISCSSDDSSDTPPANNNVAQETFGNWSPDFTNQTANFTQTRTGTQGTQQTRTIVVTITSSTATSTEEILEEDINEDEDLFDEVEITTSNYSASEGLGSYEIVSNSITKDNDMVLKIGNQAYSLKDGLIYYYGSPEDCNNLYGYGINLYSEGISFNSNTQEWSGKGSKISLYFTIESEQLYNGISLSNPLKAYNELLGTSAQSTIDIYKLINEDGGVYDEVLEGLSTCEFLEKIELNMITGYYFPNTYDGDNYNEDEQLFDLHFDNSNNNLTINKSEDGVFTLELKNSISNGQLPVSLYFNGFLDLYDLSEWYYN
jgi:hypothetical protein